MADLPYNQVGQKAEIVIDYIDPGGKSVGRHNNKLVFCRGGLPGEKVEIIIAKHKKGNLLADIVNIPWPSPRRVDPREDHYILCGPWQVMDYAYQCELKKKQLEQSFAPDAVLDDFSLSDRVFGYRTKIEYGFMEHKGKLSFSVRGHNSKVPTKKCLLASESMNRAALDVLGCLRRRDIKEKDLKSLVIRESKTTGEIIAALYLKTRKNIKITLTEIAGISGLVVAYSDPERLISVVSDILRQEGEISLIEKVGGLNIAYPFDAFFQNNIPLFNIAVNDIKSHIKPCREALEIYGGVGVIGLSVHKAVNKLESFEISSTMVDWANENAKRNSVKNYTARCVPVEKITKRFFTGKELIILDPPRKGLSAPLIKFILEVMPPQIVYLSCNHVTQSRDYNLLKTHYKPTYFAGYDFYPNTPFVETLLILDKI